MLLTALLPLMVGRAAAAPTCSSKRGLAWPTNFKNSMSAYYTWSSTPVTDAPYPFAPMLWGCSAENTSRFETALSTAFKVDNYTPKLLAHKAVLGFSEPAIKSQSNCAPAQAAAVWRQHVEPLKNKGYRLGTPAVTFDDLGRSWMSEFFAECHNCTFDFVAVHWVRPLLQLWLTRQYGTKVSDLQKTMEEVYTVYKRPIWLTGEWRACYTEAHTQLELTLSPQSSPLRTLITRSTFTTARRPSLPSLKQRRC
jgi:hypothetical protein